MSQIKIQCPNAECGKVLAVDGSLAGKKGKCSTCGTVFQIPAAVASRSGTDKAGRTGTKSPPAPRKPAAPQDRAAGPRTPPPEPRRPASRTSGRKAERPRKSGSRRPEPDDGILDADFLEDDEPIEEPVRRRTSRPVSKPATKRSRPPEDEYQDYEDYEDYEDDFGAVDDVEEYDDYDEFDRPSRRPAGRGSRKSKRGPSTTQKWRRVSVGMMISAIGLCVLAGGFAFVLLAELLMNVAVLNAVSAAESRDLGAVESARSMVEMSEVMYKIGRVFASIALATAVAGFAFFPFAPPKGGSFGLGIATLVLGSAWFIVDLVFRTLRAFGDIELLGRARGSIGYETFLVAISGGQIYRESGDKVLCLLFEIVGIAAVVLLAVFLAAAARAQKDRGHAADCMKPVWCMCGYGGVVVLLYIIAFIDWETERGAGIPWFVYVSWLIHWAANALYAVVLVFLIKALFYSRRTTG